MSWERHERQYKSIQQVLFISFIVDANYVTIFLLFYSINRTSKSINNP